MKKITILTFIIICNLNLFAQIPTSGLIARYNFDDRLGVASLRDNVASNNLLDTNSFNSSMSSTTDRFGANNAISVVNKTYIAVEPNVPFNANNQGLSFSFWLKGDTVASANSDIIKLANGLNVRAEFGRIKMGGEYGVNMSYSTQGINVNHNQWYHVVATYYSYFDGTNIYHTGTLFLNGSPAASFNSGPLARFSTTVGAGFPIGQHNMTYFNNVTGVFDDLLVYNRALSNTEIANLTVVAADGTANGYCPTVDPFRFVYTNRSGITDTTVDISVSRNTPVDIAWITQGGAFILPSQTVTNYTGGTYTITGLQPGTQYTILAKSSCNSGAYTVLGQVTTTGSALSTENFNLDIIDFNIYPNPTSGKVTINSKQNNLEKIELVSLNGKVLIVSANRKEINLSKLPVGLYILKATTKEGTSFHKKVMKK